MSGAEVPASARLRRAAASYSDAHDSEYLVDVLRAHRGLGLLRSCGADGAADDGATGTTSTSAASSSGGGGGSGGNGRGGAAADRAWAYASIAPYKDMEVSFATSLPCF